MRKEHVLGKTRRDFMVRLLCREQRYARALARVEMNKSEKRRVRTRGSGDALDLPLSFRGPFVWKRVGKLIFTHNSSYAAAAYLLCKRCLRFDLWDAPALAAREMNLSRVYLYCSGGVSHFPVIFSLVPPSYRTNRHPTPQKYMTRPHSNKALQGLPPVEGYLVARALIHERHLLTQWNEAAQLTVIPLPRNSSGGTRFVWRESSLGDLPRR